MENGQPGWITHFIWDVADDVLPDMSVRGRHCERLSADIVTGKADVREVAAQLPEAPEEAKSLEETAKTEAADETALEEERDDEG